MREKEDPWERAKKNLKARIGEAIVETILEEAGSQVRRFGQEWRTTAHQELCPEIFEFVKLADKVAKKPDFAIRNRQGGIESVEVKFMTTDLFVYLLVESNAFKQAMAHWPGTRVVIVSWDEKPHIRVLYPPYTKDDQPIDCVPIYEVPEWGVTKEMYERYERIIDLMPIHELKGVKAGRK